MQPYPQPQLVSFGYNNNHNVKNQPLYNQPIHETSDPYVQSSQIYSPNQSPQFHENNQQSLSRKDSSFYSPPKKQRRKKPVFKTGLFEKKSDHDTKDQPKTTPKPLTRSKITFLLYEFYNSI